MTDIEPSTAPVSASDAGAFFDRYAANWEAFYTDSSEHRRAFDYLNRQRQLLQLVDAFVLPESHILEFGCGAGHTACQLIMRGHRLTCLDVSPEMIQATRRTLDRAGQTAHLQVGQVRDLVAAGKELFDVIVGMGVMEYIEDHGAMFEQLAVLLKPGGICMLSFPNARSPIRRLERGMKRAVAYPLALITGKERYLDIALRPSQLHAPQDVRLRLERSGFVIEQCRYLSYGFRIGSFWVPPLPIVRRMEETLAASAVRWLGRNYIVVGRRVTK
ncbi:MAG TPA: methyltransferase domain-containing protein [Rhodothermales bacterium]|nr:methyltransferase domain-containing protein [Rhodothermales bacterium]